VADFLFIVSRNEPKQYLYLKHVFATRAGTWSLIDEEATAPEPAAAAGGATQWC